MQSYVIFSYFERICNFFARNASKTKKCVPLHAMFKNDGGKYLLNKYGCDVVTRIGAVYITPLVASFSYRSTVQNKA